MENKYKTKVVIVELTPTQPLNYTINLLRRAALTNNYVRDNAEIICLSFQNYVALDEASCENPVLTDASFLCKIREHTPDIVCFSTYVWNVGIFTRISRMLKICNSQIKIVWGGTLVIDDWRQLASNNSWVDVFCLGEGETIFPLILHGLIKNKFEAPPAGALVREELIESARRHLSSSPIIGYRIGMMPPPLPDPSLIPSPYIMKDIKPEPHKIAFIETLRGCVFKCAYCVWGGGNYRSFPEEHVEQVIQAILDARFDLAFFVDSVFAVTPTRQRRFLEYILKHHNGYTRFGFEVMMEHLHPETMKMMKELVSIGAVKKFQVGVQTTSETVAKIVRRPFNKINFTQKYWDFVQGFPDVQDEVQMDLIVGLPGETKESFLESIEFFLSLNPGGIAIFPLKVFPGAELYSKSKALGLQATPFPPYSIIETETLSPENILELTFLGWILTQIRNVARGTIEYLHVFTKAGCVPFVQRYIEFLCGQYSYDKYKYNNEFKHWLYFFEFLFLCDHDEDLTADSINFVKQMYLVEVMPHILINNLVARAEAILRKAGVSAYRRKFADSSSDKCQSVLLWLDCYFDVPHDIRLLKKNFGTDVFATPMGFLIECHNSKYQKFKINRSNFMELQALVDPTAFIIDYEPQLDRVEKEPFSEVVLQSRVMRKAALLKDVLPNAVL